MYCIPRINNVPTGLQRFNSSTQGVSILFLTVWLSYPPSDQIKRAASSLQSREYSPSYDLASPPSLPPLSHQQVVYLFQSSCVLPVMLTDGKEGVCRSPIRRRRESLVRYISFNTLCFIPFSFSPPFHYIYHHVQSCSVYTIQLRGHTPTPFSNLPLFVYSVEGTL